MRLQQEKVTLVFIMKNQAPECKGKPDRHISVKSDLVLVMNKQQNSYWLPYKNDLQ